METITLAKPVLDDSYDRVGIEIIGTLEIADCCEGFIELSTGELLSTERLPEQGFTEYVGSYYSEATDNVLTFISYFRCKTEKIVQELIDKSAQLELLSMQVDAFKEAWYSCKFIRYPCVG